MAPPTILADDERARVDPSRRCYKMADMQTADDFAPYIGKTFRAEGRHHALTFVTLDARDHAPGSAMRKPFTLILRGPHADVLPEGFYRFTIDAGPSFDLYIIPVHTAGRDHQDYQIVFN
jgi:hypothetical protein